MLRTELVYCLFLMIRIKISKSIGYSIFGIKLYFNPHAGGRADAQPYDFEIDFVRNSISGSAARFRYYPQIHFYTHL